VIFAIGLLFVLSAVPAQAVHKTGAFQLDGDAQQATSPPLSNSTVGDDWDNICASNPSTCTFQSPYTASPSTTATASAHVSDTAISSTCAGAINCTVFTGGGSKDPNNISSWNWKTDTGGLPSKDNLAHSFAARYSIPSIGSTDPTCPIPGTSPGMCKVLYFGSDRIDNSGDAQEGFWFFQNAISLNLDGTFSGLHSVGDLLILSDFSVGGTTSTINVYEWVATGGDVSTNLQSLGGGVNQACNATPALPNNDAFCGIVNATDGTIAPWTFTDKAGNHTYLKGEFYEGGINLSAFNLGGECFASFASETRSSTSPTATLKDFVLGGFGNCTSGTKTTPEDSTGTSISNGFVSIGTGSVQVKDLAVVTGLGSSIKPTGTVKFYLCGPAASDSLAQCDTSTPPTGSAYIVPDQTLSPGADTTATATSALVTLTKVGHYCFRADYQGDTNYPKSSDRSLTECFTVTPVTPTISTSATGPVHLGTAINDTATLGGTANKPGTGGPSGDPSINPTAQAAAGGTITFSLYGPSATAICSTAIATRVVTVSGNGNYIASSGTGTGSLTPTSVGTYYWIATYSGDSPNTSGPVSTACGDSGESSVVNNTTSVTTPEDFSGTSISNGSVSIGTGSVQVQDLAVVTGAGSTANPTGTVKFYICGPAASDALAQCDTNTPPTGGAYIVPDQTLSPGAGSTSTATSALVTVTTVGHYCFRADYQGDSLYPASSDRSLTECFTVTPVTPTISTSASGPVFLGSAINDTATLGGTANRPGTGGLSGDPSINPTAQAAAGGTITFSLYGPSATAICSTAIATRVVTVSGNGNYIASSGTGTGSLTPTSVGTYYWIATYSGDSPNTSGPVSTACGDPGESSVVNDTTVVLTDQTWVPNDQAQVSSVGGSSLSGSVVFTLYPSGNCTGTALYTSSSIPISGASPQTANSNNTVHVSATTSVSWKVVYTSTANNVTGSTSSCESTSLTITNNPGYLPLP
jgi:hypothetical protein